MICIEKMQNNWSFKSAIYINYNHLLCSSNFNTSALFTKNCVCKTMKVLMTWMQYWFHLISLVTKNSSLKLFSLWVAFGRLCNETLNSGYPFLLFLCAWLIKVAVISDLNDNEHNMLSLVFKLWFEHMSKWPSFKEYICMYTYRIPDLSKVVLISTKTK